MNPLPSRFSRLQIGGGLLLWATAGCFNWFVMDGETIELVRSGYAGGDLYTARGRTFLVVQLKHRIVLELHSDGRISLVGGFDLLRDCEAGIRKAILTGTRFTDDIRAELPPTFKDDKGKGGLASFVCRLRQFQVMNPRKFSGERHRDDCWEMTEITFKGQRINRGTFTTLDEAKHRIITLCRMPGEKR